MKENLSMFDLFNKSKAYHLLIFISITLTNAYILQAQVISTFAGSGTIGSVDGSSTLASFNAPKGVVVDASGNVYIADAHNNKIRKITSDGKVTTFAGSGSEGSLDSHSTLATFNCPTGIAIDISGNLYVADFNNNKIRKITPEGMVTTFAGSGAEGSLDSTGILASFYHPIGVAVDISGNVYVSDCGNNKIRKITSTGIVTTLAGSGIPGSKDATGILASFDHQFGITVDLQGNVYVADMLNNTIRKITPEGLVTTIAGSIKMGSRNAIGTSSRFNLPTGVIVDASGNIYVADWANDKIRKITTTTGRVTTLLSPPPFFWCPNGITIDTYGNMYVVDATNNKVFKIPLDLK